MMSPLRSNVGMLQTSVDGVTGDTKMGEGRRGKSGCNGGECSQRGVCVTEVGIDSAVESPQRLLLI